MNAGYTAAHPEEQEPMTAARCMRSPAKVRRVLLQPPILFHSYKIQCVRVSRIKYQRWTAVLC